MPAQTPAIFLFSLSSINRSRGPGGASGFSRYPHCEQYLASPVISVPHCVQYMVESSPGTTQGSGRCSEAGGTGQATPLTWELKTGKTVILQGIAEKRAFLRRSDNLRTNCNVSSKVPGTSGWRAPSVNFT